VRDLSQRSLEVKDAVMVTLATTSQFLAALRRARQIDLRSYELAPGPVEDALVAAARGGASVSVRLAGAPFASAGPAAVNARALARLRAAGARTCESAGAFHAKLARVDGALYLDDRNWSVRGDTILRVPASSSAAVTSSKRAALAAEARLLARARRGERVEISSESFGFASPLYSLLRNLAARGVQVHLCVARSELQPGGVEDRALARLAAAGASVRLGDSREKFAILGKRVWIGSANATYAAPGACDWGLQTGVASVRSQLQARFAETWAHARAYAEPATIG